MYQGLVQKLNFSYAKPKIRIDKQVCTWLGHLYIIIGLTYENQNV